MSANRVGVVTGANKGIGFSIVRQLALQYPKSPYNNGLFVIYLTARDQQKGERALQALQEDPALKSAKALGPDGGLAQIKFHALDISETESIQDFASFLKMKHPEGIDFVINNAGIALQGFDSEVVKTTLECNYYGTLETNQDLLPLIRNGGRFVNVSSTAGNLSKYSLELQKRFRSASSTKDTTKLMKEFEAAVAAGNEKEQGWISAAYATSKAGVTAVTRCLAEEQKAKRSKTLINSCCPGWVMTDMTRGGGSKTPDQGAQTPVMLALEDIGGKTGLFWRDEEPIEP